MAILPEPNFDKHAEITPEQARAFLANQVWEPEPAVQLVIRDAERAEAAESSKQWVTGWGSAQTLYQSPYTPRYWPGTQSEAASIQFFTVACAVNGIKPQALSGLFYEDPPFIIQERPGTTSQAARAVSALLQYQLEDIQFKTQLRWGIANCLLFGTVMFQWGWEKFTRERTIIKRKEPAVVIGSTVPGAEPVRITDDELEEEVIEEVVDRPTFEHIVNLREVLVDPGLNVPDVRQAKYVVRRRYMTWDDLDKLRDREGYNIPSREKLLELFLPPQETPDAAVGELGQRNPVYDMRAEPRWQETTSDPFQKPLEVLERWDNKTYIVVLQKKLAIYNGPNVYGKIPFLSLNWWDVPAAYWGIGLGKSIGTEQRLQQGVTNLVLDNASLNLNGVYTRVRGKSIPTQSIRIAPGKIIEVDNKDDFKPLDRLPAVPEAAQILAMSQGRVDMVSGANPITSMGQAGAAGHSNLARSSAGAQGLLNGASNPIADFVDTLADQVFVPFLYEMMQMNRRLLPYSQLDFIMNKELKHEYLKDDGTHGDLIDILNARVKFDILAGSKMQTRRNMAQALPLLTQSLASPALTEQLQIQGMKINWLEIIRMWFESAEFRNVNDVIVPMSQEDLQRLQAQSQAALQNSKFAQQSQLQDQKFNQQQQLADAENVARAARDVLRESFKKSVEPDVLSGEPIANTGFGSLA